MKTEKLQQRAGVLGRAASEEHTLGDAVSFEEADIFYRKIGWQKIKHITVYFEAGK